MSASLRVLQVNKFFRPGAGAETAYLQTRELLRSRGHEVIDFAMRHPENLPSPQSAYFARRREYGPGRRRASALRDSAASVYSLEARRALGRLLDRERPDVAHLHNVYHQLTLSVVDELVARRVPIVLTMHDWKVACPSYTLFTEGAPCRRCPTSGVHNAVLHRCVKDSRPASLLAAAEAALASIRGTYGKVGRFVAPSRFAMEVAELAGIPGERVVHLPNFLPAEELGRDVVAGDDGPVLLFAGRLEATKGVRELLRAFADVPAAVRLRIAGQGELDEEVRTAAAADSRIEVLGRLPREELLRHYARARGVVLPSIWEDNGPFVILEAQAQATALIVSDRGGPKEFVRDGETGFVVDPEDVGALSEAMTRLALDTEVAREFGARSRAHVIAEHGEQMHYDRLLGVYEAAMEVARSR